MVSTTIFIDKIGDDGDNFVSHQMRKSSNCTHFQNHVIDYKIWSKYFMLPRNPMFHKIIKRQHGS